METHPCRPQAQTQPLLLPPYSSLQGGPNSTHFTDGQTKALVRSAGEMDLTPPHWASVSSSEKWG